MLIAHDQALIFFACSSTYSSTFYMEKKMNRITRGVCSLLVALLTLTFAVAASAAGSINVSKSAEYAVPADKLWTTVKAFEGLHTWHPAVEKTDMKKGVGSKVGNVRLLTLGGGGGVITETLVRYSDSGKRMTYKIDDSPLPVQAYVSTIAVKPTASGGSKITWSSTFKAKAGAKDADAKKTIEGIYEAGFENLKKLLG
jgi:Polyketide cyclase / dehydrase and lipid transport